jgi:hypothetical protein
MVSEYGLLIHLEQHDSLMIEQLWPLNFTVTFLSRSRCQQDPIDVFPEMKLRGLIPNFPVHVSVSDLFIPTIGPPILLQQNRRTDRGNI